MLPTPSAASPTSQPSQAWAWCSSTLIDGSARTVRLDMARALDAYAAGPGALVALAEREELWRMLATTKDAVPVEVARRCAVLAAMGTRADCADLVWRMGIVLPVDHHERPALCEAGLSIGRLALPTDDAPVAAPGQT
ncbi:hypothetical protein [Myxococcus sp. AB036A]|uniref:hypothetical protein n=1 Tax=Myxococcus sp. AB036A TaxID=2562793 RepID=UPI0018912444|nr:hypothetical protein [Myxococcus sp. AB036A]